MFVQRRRAVRDVCAGQGGSEVKMIERGIKVEAKIIQKMIFALFTLYVPQSYHCQQHTDLNHQGQSPLERRT